MGHGIVKSVLHMNDSSTVQPKTNALSTAITFAVGSIWKFNSSPPVFTHHVCIWNFTSHIHRPVHHHDQRVHALSVLYGVVDCSTI